MRYALALLLALTACAAEPVLLPDASTPDAGPCGGACGAGTSCVSGACVVDDAGAPDAVAVDSGAAVDVGEDRPAVDAGELDAGMVDAGGVDARDVVDVPARDAPDVPCFAPEALCPGATNCARLDINASHCGRCGNACPTAPGTVSLCAAGVCSSRCATGFTDCDGNAANGCEARLNVSDPNNCGACGRTCPSGMRCAGDRCTNICGATVTYCGGSCVDTATDARHCGRCGNACSAGANSTVACVGGACVLTCDSIHADCDGIAANGCETFTGTRANCGSCGIVCAGTLDCANVGTGAAPVLRCGCGNSTTTVACGTTCVNLLRSHDHCGACGNNCGDHGFCNNAGACLSCGNNPEGIPRTWCGTACTDLTTDDQNCGTCGTRCSAGRLCFFGTCR